MRRTGKLYTLTLVSSFTTVIAASLLVFWNEDTSWLHLWFDIVPQSLGMASVITTTLIVSLRAHRRGVPGTLIDVIRLGNDCKCGEGRFSCRDRQYVKVGNFSESVC